MATTIQFIREQIWLFVIIAIIIVFFLSRIRRRARRHIDDKRIFIASEQHKHFLIEERELVPGIFGILNVQIPAGEIWLLYKDGLLIRRLPPGRHSWWEGIFHDWTIQRINVQIHLLSFTIKGQIKGPPPPNLAKRATNEEVIYNIEVEFGLACKIADIENFISYIDPITIFLTHVKNMIFDLLSTITYEYYDRWATTLRDAVKQRLLTNGEFDPERLLGLRVESVYIISRNASTLSDYNVQYGNTDRDTNAVSTEIFISYAREDEKWRIELEKQLSNLQNQGLVLSWHDRQIGVGMEWEYEIKKHLETAQLILLLISPDFMASKFCYSTELQQAMKRHSRREARVIPIILRPVDWEGAPFSKLQILPTDAKPVLSSYWHSADDAFLNVAQGIRKSIEEFKTSP